MRSDIFGHAHERAELDFQQQRALSARLRDGTLKITPITPSPRARAFYYGFTPDVTDDAARTRFEQVYGATPHELIRTGGAVLAGPIPGTGGIPFVGQAGAT